jgi:hypothetical protein
MHQTPEQIGQAALELLKEHASNRELLRALAHALDEELHYSSRQLAVAMLEPHDETRIKTFLHRVRSGQELIGAVEEMRKPKAPPASAQGEGLSGAGVFGGAHPQGAGVSGT